MQIIGKERKVSEEDHKKADRTFLEECCRYEPGQDQLSSSGTLSLNQSGAGVP
jgi:hypothetical protein